MQIWCNETKGIYFSTIVLNLNDLACYTMYYSALCTLKTEKSANVVIFSMKNVTGLFCRIVAKLSDFEKHLKRKNLALERVWFEVDCNCNFRRIVTLFVFNNTTREAKSAPCQDLGQAIDIVERMFHEFLRRYDDSHTAEKSQLYTGVKQWQACRDKKRFKWGWVVITEDLNSIWRNLDRMSTARKSEKKKKWNVIEGDSRF